MAPELWSPEDVIPAPAADIYACGILFWEMGCRKRPWAGTHPAAIGNLVVEGCRPHFPSQPDRKFSSAFCELLARCWHANPGSRPSANEVFSSLKTEIGVSGGIYACE